MMLTYNFLDIEPSLKILAGLFRNETNKSRQQSDEKHIPALHRSSQVLLWTRLLQGSRSPDSQ